MKLQPEHPLMVQSDGTVLLEADHPQFEEIRRTLARFADLLKSPGQLHTYKISRLSLWNAAAAGMNAEEVVAFLKRHAKLEVAKTVIMQIRGDMNRYGLLRLQGNEHALRLVSQDPELLRTFFSCRTLQGCLIRRIDETTAEISPAQRGTIKQELLKLGYPVQDLAAYHSGESLAVRLREGLPDGRSFTLRDYQLAAVQSFYAGGSGVLVLPCGAGKTVIGIAAMARLGCAALILTPNVTSVRQWKEEILQKTDLQEALVGEYCGAKKEVRPVTIATYQILTHRKTKEDEFSHMQLFEKRDWGLIIYDEVHLLPAPVFRVTAELQAKRRLGLTATLVREDGREGDVFSLVGPKRFDVTWKELEGDGWIATVECAEIQVALPELQRRQYENAGKRSRFRIAGENPQKLAVVRQLLAKHEGEPTLVIGQYLAQLKQISAALAAPLISGEMPYEQRDTLYREFKEGKIPLLVVSKVANFAVDLPDASVAIQVSGSFGSRQEEAQRLGRILRPKRGGNRAYFYTLVSQDTNEADFAVRRQLFLVEQGYRYEMVDFGVITDAELMAR